MCRFYVSAGDNRGSTLKGDKLAVGLVFDLIFVSDFDWQMGAAC